MGTVIDLMLSVKEKSFIFYHKDTNCFDCYPIFEKRRKIIPLTN